MPQRKGTYSIPLHIMKAFRNSGRRTPLLTSALVGCDWSASRPSRFTLRGKKTGKMYFDFLYNISLKHLILRRIQRDIIIIVHGSSL